MVGRLRPHSKPNGAAYSQRRSWYPRSVYVGTLVVAAMICGFALGKSPNPMEGAVKVFKAIVGLQSSVPAVFVDYARIQSLDAVAVAVNNIGAVLEESLLDAAVAEAALARTPTLVILDNLEALVALVAEPLTKLLDAAVGWSAAGGSRMLCTTRHPEFGHAAYLLLAVHVALDAGDPDAATFATVVNDFLGSFGLRQESEASQTMNSQPRADHAARWGTSVGHTQRSSPKFTTLGSQQSLFRESLSKWRQSRDMTTAGARRAALKRRRVTGQTAKLAVDSPVVPPRVPGKLFRPSLLFETLPNQRGIYFVSIAIAKARAAARQGASARFPQERSTNRASDSLAKGNRVW